MIAGQQLAGADAVSSHLEPCERCPVRSFALCQFAEPGSRTTLAAISRRRVLAEPATLAWEGEASPQVGIVRSGLVKLTVSGTNGDEQIVGIARAGDFIGRPFGGVLPYGIGAAGKAEVCLFPRDAFDRVAGSDSGLQHELLASTLEELERTRRWLGMLGRKNAEQKVAAFVAEFAGLRTSEATALKGITLDLPFNRQQIADILGLTIETVSRQFTWLRRRGAIDLPTSRQVHILDSEMLMAISGEYRASKH